MCLLLESIKIQNKIPLNIERHNARLNKSRKEIFGLTDSLDLHDAIKTPSDLTDNIYKCRVIYAEYIQRIEFIPYMPRLIRNLRLIVGEYIEYKHKYLDITALENLKNNCGADDVLIVKHNKITDSSFANVVLFDGKSWITPALPLLKGTKRQLLLESGIICEDDITLHNLKYFKKIVLINAMLDLDDNRSLPIQNILPLQ